MNKFFLALTWLCAVLLTSCAATKPTVQNQSIPGLFLGEFKDDYGSRYTITDTLWTHQRYAGYRILEWHPREQYFLAQNNFTNPADAGLFTRIDVMQFAGMEPYLWGFCLTEYKAPTKEEARKNTSTDRKNPRTGCNGFPFSRMKRTTL